MTFHNFSDFVEWLDDCDVTAEEVDHDDEYEYVTITNINDTDPMLMTEILVAAADSEFYVSELFAGESNGLITIVSG